MPKLMRAFRKRARFALLVVLVLASVGFLWFSFAMRTDCPWLSDLTLNLAASAITFFLAIFLVDWFLAQHDEARWEPVSHHIGFYARRVASLCVYGYRVAEGIGDKQLPTDRIESDRLRWMADWIEGTIIPRIPKLRHIDRSKWQLIRDNLIKADDEAKEVLVLYGSRLKPSVFEAIVEVRRSIKRALIDIEDFPEILGVPVDEIKIAPDRRAYELIEMWQEKYPHIPEREAIEVIKTSMQSGAEKSAQEVLQAAVSLLEATIPLIALDRD